MLIKIKILSFVSIKYFTFVKPVNCITGWESSLGLAT